jgi:hypothetical protein
MQQHQAILASHPEQVARIQTALWHLKAEGVRAIDIVEIVEAALARHLTLDGFEVEAMTALLNGEIATDLIEVTAKAA